MKLYFDELVKQEIIDLTGDLTGMGLHDDDLDVIIKVLRDKDAVVKTLYLDGNNITLVDGKFTDALAKNNTLEVVNLNNNNIGVEGAKVLAEALKVNTTLERIYLDGNNIGDGGAKYLARVLMEIIHCNVLI